MLETINFKFLKPVVQRVTVVKFGVYNGGGNCFCGVKVKVRRDGYSGEHERDDSRIKTVQISDQKRKDVRQI